MLQCKTRPVIQWKMTMSQLKPVSVLHTTASHSICFTWLHHILCVYVVFANYSDIIYRKIGSCLSKMEEWDMVHFALEIQFDLVLLKCHGPSMLS
jgi:hypothetical protein